MSRPTLGRRRWLRGLAILSGLAMFAGPSWASDKVVYPSRSVLMFVASWCAPCREELLHLPAISAAARPWDVLVIPMDDTPGTRTLLAAVPVAHLRWQPDSVERQMVADDIFQEAGGLPFSVVTDQAGRPCASIRSGLNAGRVKQLLTAC